MKKQTKEKRISKISQFITKWGAPLVHVFSYGLILGLAATGIGLMACSMLAGLILGSGLLSGFGFLTGGVIFTAGCSLVLWKLNRELEALGQSLQDPDLA